MKKSRLPPIMKNRAIAPIPRAESNTPVSAIVGVGVKVEVGVVGPPGVAVAPPWTIIVCSHEVALLESPELSVSTADAVYVPSFGYS